MFGGKCYQYVTTKWVIELINKCPEVNTGPDRGTRVPIVGKRKRMPIKRPTKIIEQEEGGEGISASIA